MRFFDTHCHLAGDELAPKAVELARNALGRQVEALAVIAADLPSLRMAESTAKEIRDRVPGLQAVFTAGLHPHEADDIADAEWQEVVDLAARAVAIGETGLDYFYDHSDRAVQRKLFQKHIDLACELKKPLVIHCREARHEMIEFLDTPAIKNHPNPGILHCFTENADFAHRLLDLGFYISFSGILSFKNAENLREVARQVPLERLLIETDSPWLAPIPNRGKRNEPAFVTDVFACLKDLRPEQPDQLAEALWENSRRVFSMA